MIKENTKLRKINLVSSIFFILVAIFYFGYEKSTFSRQETVDVSVPVVSVSDGDTVILIISGHKEKVRLIGIDAPELAQKQWGEKAKRYLEALLRDSAWKVKLEYDVEKETNMAVSLHI